MQRKFLFGASLAALVLPLACVSAQAGGFGLGKGFGLGTPLMVPGGSLMTPHMNGGSGNHKIGATASHSPVAAKNPAGGRLAAHRPGIGGVAVAGGAGAVVTPSVGGNAPAISQPAPNGGSGGTYSQSNTPTASQSNSPTADNSEPVTGRASDLTELACPPNGEVRLHIEETQAPLQVFVNGELAGIVRRDATPSTMDLTSFVDGGNTRVELASRRVEDEPNPRGYLDCNGWQANVTDGDSSGKLYRQAFLLRRR